MEHLRLLYSEAVLDYYIFSQGNEPVSGLAIPVERLSCNYVAGPAGYVINNGSIERDTHEQVLIDSLEGYTDCIRAGQFRPCLRSTCGPKSLRDGRRS